MSNESIALSVRPVSLNFLYLFLQRSITLLVIGFVQGLAWLWDLSPLWCWASCAVGLVAVTRDGWISSFWATLTWSTLTIAVAFHWAPAAMAFTLGSEFWLGLLVALPLIAWDGLRMSAGYYLASRITRDVRWIWLTAGLSSVAIESFIPSVFPWRIGMLQLGWPWLIQSVDLLGPCICTIIAFAHAGLLLMIIGAVARRPHAISRSALGCCLAIVLANAVYGLTSFSIWQRHSERAPQLRVALIQVDPSYTESTNKARQLTSTVAGQVDLVCWPESSGGSYEAGLDDLRNATEVFAKSREPERGLQPWTTPTCELLLGGKNYTGDPIAPTIIHVTAMLIDRQQQIRGRYHKRYLMPFGEYVPFESTIPGMAQLFDMAEHVSQGQSSEPIEATCGAKLGAMLCYEDMVSQASIDMTRSGANLLVSLINGSAFESPITLHQHRLLAQLRAVECRKCLLRCAATGQTCVIQADGTLSHQLPVQQDDVLVSQAPLLPGPTVYVRYPWLGLTMVMIGLVVAVGYQQTHLAQRS